MNRPASDRIRVLIVDDHEIVRAGLRTVLERAVDLKIVGESGTVASAIADAQRLRPDVVLMDVRLPDGSGCQACREIHASCDSTRVLVLTSFADDETVFNAINAGADGYLLKEVNSDALIRSIRQVAAGQSVLDPAVTSRVFGRLKDESPVPARGIDILSAQERRVLALVAHGKTNKEIAVEMSLSDKTVKNYLSNILDKLQMNRRSQAAAFYVQHTSR